MSQSPLTFSSAIPILRIFDEPRAREFYVDYLGFTVEFEHRFADDLPLYMCLRLGNCHLHLSEHSGDGTPGSRLHIEVSDIDAFHASLDTSYKYAHPSIEPKPWGVREVAVADPFSNVLHFFTPN